MKEDQVLTLHGITMEEIQAIVIKKRAVPFRIAMMIKEGNSISEIDKTYPDYVMLNQTKMAAYQSLQSMIKLHSSLLPWTRATTTVHTSWNDRIVIWLNENIKQLRRMKDLQLWLWSHQSGRGKSTLLLQLAKMLRIYRLSRNDWDDTYLDGEYDLAVADEYRGHKPIEWINAFAEGSTTILSRRGTADVVKHDKLPLIICSNLPIYEAYAQLKASDIELIECRFQQVEVDDDNGLIRIDFEGVDVNDL